MTVSLMMPFRACERRCTSFSTCLLFIISLLISYRIASAENCKGESVRWMTANIDEKNHTGMKDDPFTTFDEVNFWVSQVRSGSACSALLYLTNGIYFPVDLPLGINFTIASCLDCVAYPPDMEQIIFDVSTFDDILFMVTAPLTISNVTFIGSLPSLYAQQMSEAKKTGLSVGEFVERLEPLLDSEARSVPPITRNGTIFMVISSSLVLDNVVFLSIESSNPLMNIYFGNITLKRVIFARNRIVSNQRNIYRGGVVSSMGGFLFISESYFFSNYLLAHDKQTSRLGGGAIYAHAGTLSVVQTGFKGNIVLFLNSHPSQFAQVSGGAVRIGDVKSAQITGCMFKENMAVAYSSVIPTVGGALSFLNSGSVHISDSIFSGNAADVGGAIGQVFKSSDLLDNRQPPTPENDSKTRNFEYDSNLRNSENDSKTKFPDPKQNPFGDDSSIESNTSAWAANDPSLRVVIFNSTIVLNKCFIRGCGISLNPSVSRLHALVFDSEISHNEYYVNETKMCAQFSDPILQTGMTREIAGGVGLSLVSRSASSISDRLTLRKVVFQNNTVQLWGECVLGGGIALSVFGADTTLLHDCTISHHNGSSSMNALIWVRQFNVFNMRSTRVTHNQLILRNAILSIIDVQGDRELAIGHNSFSLVIYNCFFEYVEASTVIRIATVRRILFQDVIFQGDPLDFGVLTDRNSYLRIEDVSDVLVMNNVTSAVVPYPHHISSVHSLSITNSTFQGYQGPSVRTTGHLTLQRISQVEISNSKFLDNLAGSIDATSTNLAIENCYFARNRCSRPGCAILFDLGELWMRGSRFSENQGTEGGAVMILHSTYHGNDLVFEYCRANSGSGGGICSSQSTGYLSNITCHLNFATHGGCLGSPVQTEESPNSWKLVASNITFIQNLVTESGGAIYVPKSAEIYLEGAVFKQNRARLSGGAIAAEKATVSISNAIFDSNSAGMMSGNTEPFYGYYGQSLSLNGDGGGAIHMRFSSALILNDCQFTDNVARYIGGAILAQSAKLPQLNINRCTFRLNRAGHFAGALFLQVTPSSGPIARMGVLSNSRFAKNQATYGGAILFRVEYFSGSIPNTAKSPWQNIFDHSKHTLTSPKREENLIPVNLLLANVSFTRNSAQSGGAISTAEPKDSYFQYQNLSFIHNEATITGGAFYSSDSYAVSMPDFCNSSQCVAVPSNSTHSKFGPIYGSIGWRVYPVSLIAARSGTVIASSPSLAPTLFEEEYSPHNSTRTRKERPISQEAFFQQNSIQPNVTIPVYYGEYVLNLVAFDRYDQQVWDTKHTYTARPEVICLNAEPHCPVIEILEGENSLRIQIMAPLSTKLPLEPYSSDTTNLASVPIKVWLKIHFEAQKGPNWSFLNQALYLNLTVSKCPAGSGLQETSLSSEVTSCYECPINSYNYDGDGQCYLCNVWSKTPTAQMICAGSTVSYMDNYWATTVRGTNQLFVNRCLMGNCKRGQCSARRTGILCAECQEGNFESLFSFCSPTLCEKPNILFLILVFAVLIIISCGIHQFLPRWPTMTMFTLFFAQMSVMIIQYPFDWALPRSSPLLASLLCGFRTGPVHRALFFMFFPYASLLVLWVPWLIYLPVSCIFRRIELGTAGRWLHWRRLLMTSIAISFTLTSNSLKQVLEWLNCMDTPMGKLWSVAPSIQCTSAEFSNARIFVLVFGFPLVLLPLGASLWFTSTTTALPTWQLGSRQFLAASGSRTLFHFLTSNSRLWPVVEMVIRILVPVTVVYGYSREAVTSSALGLLFVIGAGFSIPFSPFLLWLQRSSVTVSLSVLAVIGIFRGDLIFSKTPTAIIVTFCLILLHNLVLLIVLIIGKPSEKSSTNVESEWDRFSENEGEDETKSLVSFHNSEPETDSAIEDLLHHED